MILFIGFSELLLEFVLYSYRSIKNFSFSNYILILRIMPRFFAFVGILRNDINLIINLYSATFIISCISIFLFLYRRYSCKINFFFRKNLNFISFLSPAPYLQSLSHFKKVSFNNSYGFFFFSFFLEVLHFQKWV